MKVLFICIHNSARSQLAEELLRKLGGNPFEVESAGLEPGKVNPVVIEVLKEEEIDIANKQTQSVDEVLRRGEAFDYVITVCDETSAQACPTFPGKAKKLHWPFEDPGRVEGTFQEKSDKVREIKSQIKAKIQDWLLQLSSQEED